LDGRPIVVGYDGSAASDAAAHWAAQLAQRLGRRVRMIHVVPWPALRGSGGAVVALGSVMAHIATHASTPVVVVPAHWRPRPDRPGEVVVGVDGSAESWNAIAFGFEFAEQTGASVTAVLAWHDPTSTGPGDMLFPVHDVVALAEDSSVVLSEAVAGQAVDHPDVKVTERLVHGAPAKVLEAQSQEADLLVVGSRGRGRIRGFLLGSVSRAVLHHATCPVAVVR
jgi:nucleotide-binding universal stress UspA family protein